jgi:hypothetical protein
MLDHAAYIGDDVKNLTKDEIAKKVAKVKKGADAPLTEEIYGIQPEKEPLTTDVLPHPVRGLDIPHSMLQKFISTYQPSELISQQIFRKELLQILEEWRMKHAS